jgi:hypothetical protein
VTHAGSFSFTARSMAPRRIDARSGYRSLSANDESRGGIGKTLKNWRRATDIERIRDDAGLAQRPEAESIACRSLQAAVDALLKSSRGMGGIRK